jgi:hypothetical protein
MEICGQELEAVARAAVDVMCRSRETKAADGIFRADSTADFHPRLCRGLRGFSMMT